MPHYVVFRRSGNRVYYLGSGVADSPEDAIRHVRYRDAQPLQLHVLRGSGGSEYFIIENRIHASVFSVDGGKVLELSCPVTMDQLCEIWDKMFRDVGVNFGEVVIHDALGHVLERWECDGPDVPRRDRIYPLWLLRICEY